MANKPHACADRHTPHCGASCWCNKTTSCCSVRPGWVGHTHTSARKHTTRVMMQQQIINIREVAVVCTILQHAYWCAQVQCTVAHGTTMCQLEAAVVQMLEGQRTTPLYYPSLCSSLYIPACMLVRQHMRCSEALHSTGYKQHCSIGLATQ